jgi:hypothetical protein
MNGPEKTIAMFFVFLLIPAVTLILWLDEAKSELAAAHDATEEVAIASAAEDAYCSPALKKVLRRVAGACGLIEGSSRGCKPGDAKTVAALSGEDFNTLFVPLSHRVSIIQFDSEQVDLDEGAKKLVEDTWGEQRGASFFFVVARASADGDTRYNQMLSQKRAEGVLGHLEHKFHDSDLRKEVGLLWLGEEYAQLDEKFCGWKRSRDGECSIKDINRSAFVAWIDCAI